jgi:Xaa-Pro dipeptidase
VSAAAATPETGARRERLARALAGAGFGAAAVVAPELVYYLTGAEPYPGEAAALLVRDDRAVLVWPGEAPGAVDDAVEVASYDRYAAARGRGDGFGAVAGGAAAALGLAGRRVAVDADARPAWLSGEAAGSPLFGRLTRPKSASEVGAIAANLAANDQAFAAVAARLAAGSTDLDVLDWCTGALSRAAGRPVSYVGNIGLGPRGDDFDAQPVGAVVTEGASLFVDLYPRIGHYVGDSTRSFCAGSAPAWLDDAHARLEHALETVAALLVPGAVAGDLDRICREALAAAAPAAAFPHHTGHGIGLTAHEAPYLVPGSRDRLEPGDVVAVEPGLYVAGHGGVRLEDVFVVSDDGARPLTTFPRTLTECHGPARDGTDR